MGRLGISPGVQGRGRRGPEMTGSPAASVFPRRPRLNGTARFVSSMASLQARTDGEEEDDVAEL